MTCTFFGHKNTPDKIISVLKNSLIYLIKQKGVNLFYVGNHGNFDYIVYKTLKDISKEYSIAYRVVLAYLPEKQQDYNYLDFFDTILPPGIESVPKRFAINFRNNYMLNNSDIVVTYITQSISSHAAKFKEKAVKKKKEVIELSDISKHKMDV